MMHATHENDTFACMATFALIPTQSYPADLFDRLRIGIPHGKFGAFFEKFSRALGTSSTMVMTPYTAVRLLFDLHACARDISRETTDLTAAHRFIYALYRSSLVFSRLCTLVNTSLDATDKSVVDQLSSPMEGPVLRSPVLLIICIVQRSAGHVFLHEPQEGEAFIRSCFRAGLVDTLERLMLSHFIQVIPREF